jgi:multidrug transporter EmrE-like cation transporter
MILGLSDIVRLLSFPLLMSIGQVMFRHSALQTAGKPLSALLPALLKVPIFYGAILLYGFCTVLWIWLLARYTLSIAYPFAAIAVAAVPVVEMLVFRQRMPPLYWLGLGLIMAGVLIIARIKS